MILKRLVIAAFLPALALAADPELTNYRSGIDLVWQGEKGVDYAEEYMYHDKLIADWKVVYIKDTTPIAMSHNERNIAGNPSGTDEYIAVDPSVGKIRYKVDGDQRWGQGPLWWIPYESPIQFSQFNYELFGDPGIKVVGSTGDNGLELSVDTKTSYYHKGIKGPYGDEWHIITVADDDSTYAGGDAEFDSSDGKVFVFVVNPKTPALTVRSSGTGEFYTTPAKKYFIPVIYEQTTYIDEGASGEVSFEITDINGNNVFYRINGGSFKAANSKTARLTHNDFNLGNNTLEYYYAGNENFVKKRKVVRKPDYPSKNENHGDKLWLGTSNWVNDVKPRLAGTAPLSQPINDFLKNWATRKHYPTKYRTGKRSIGGGLEDALVARYYSMNRTYKEDTKPNSYWAKSELFMSRAIIDPVGAELNHSNTPIPSREWFYRGYYDVNSIISNAATYDILAGYYRRDQGYAEGLSPVEDYFIRDVLGRWVYISSLFIAGYNDPAYGDFNSGGMWETSRNVGAALITAMMPSYSTPYYGTSGMDGSTNNSPWTPFRDVQYTWKQIFFDNNMPLEKPGFPNVHKRMGVVDYMINEDGNYLDRRGYMSTDKMGSIIATYYNLNRIFTPEVPLPSLDRLQDRAPINQLFGLKTIDDDDKLPVTQVFACWQNRWFPGFKTVAQPVMLAVTNTTSDNHVKKQLLRGGPLYVVWYNHNIPLPARPTNPTDLFTK